MIRGMAALLPARSCHLEVSVPGFLDGVQPNILVSKLQGATNDATNFSLARPCKWKFLIFPSRGSIDLYHKADEILAAVHFTFPPLPDGCLEQTS